MVKSTLQVIKNYRKSNKKYEAAKEKVKEFKDKHSNNETASNPSGSDYDESKFPDMYEVLGEAEIDERKFSTTYSYSHDDLDRTTTAYGLVNYKAVMDSKGWRADFELNSEPSGWYKGKESNNKKVSVKLPTGKIYNGYFYNRSHLIADSLGGRSYKYNVVTCTRQQNVYYSVEPYYEGNELVPRYVIVNAKSDDGVINEKVKVFNNASGYEINYSDGSFTKK